MAEQQLESETHHQNNTEEIDEMDSRTKIFVHGLHPYTTAHDLISTFSKYCDISDLVFKKNPKTGKHNGYAFFSVPNRKTAQELIKNDHKLHNRLIHCDLKHNNLEEQRKNQRRRLFIGGLPRNISDIELTNIFKKFGKVRAAYSIKDLQGKSKNFGYVDFCDEETASKVLGIGKFRVKDKLVEVKPYVKKKKNNVERKRNWQGETRLGLAGQFCPPPPGITGHTFNRAGQEYDRFKNQYRGDIDHSLQSHYKHYQSSQPQMSYSSNLFVKDFEDLQVREVAGIAPASFDGTLNNPRYLPSGSRMNFRDSKRESFDNNFLKFLDVNKDLLKNVENDRRGANVEEGGSLNKSQNNHITGLFDKCNKAEHDHQGEGFKLMNSLSKNNHLKNFLNFSRLTSCHTIVDGNSGRAQNRSYKEKTSLKKLSKSEERDRKFQQNKHGRDGFDLFAGEYRVDNLTKIFKDIENNQTTKVLERACSE